MRKSFFIIAFIALLMLMSCGNDMRSTAPDGFTWTVRLKTTPIKDQARNDICWIYAMLATIETEHLMRGDSVSLSPDYLARVWLKESVTKYYDADNKKEPSMRGVLPMALNLHLKYGALPQDEFDTHGSINFRSLQRRLMQIKSNHGNRISPTLLDKEIDDMLDRELGVLPKYAYLYGARYTPTELAQSMSLANEYVTLTAIADKPLGESVILPFKDNQTLCKGINIGADSIVSIMKRRLAEGHPVAWEGGPNDNHAVAIIGMGRDKDHHLWFVGKNSWGKRNDPDGLIYIPSKYVRRYTSMIVTTL